MEQRRKNPWLAPLLLVVSHLLISVAFVSSSSGANAPVPAPAPADGGGNGKGTRHHETPPRGDCRGHHHHHTGGGRDGQRAWGPPATSNPWVVSPGPPASTAGAAARPDASGFVTAATGVVLVGAAVGWLLVWA